MPAWRRATWSWCRTCPSRRASSIPRRRPARSTPPERPEGAPPEPEPDPKAPPPPPPVGSGFTNSDLAFKGIHAVVGNYHGFNTYDVENARRPKLVASIVCPGGQGDVSIWGNLLFMSVEQTRGRLDCGVQGVTAAGERGALPRHPHLRHHQPQEPEAGGGDPDLPRLAHPHAGPRQERSEQPLSLRLGHQHRAIGRGAGRLLGPQARGGSEHRALQHRRDQGAAEEPREGGDRQPAAHLRRRDHRRHRRAVAGRQSRRGHAEDEPDQPVPRHHGVLRTSGWRPAPARATAS